MTRTLLSHIVLLLVCSAVAFWSWVTPQSKTSAREKPAAIFAEEALSSLVYVSGQKEITLTITGDKESYAAEVHYIAPEKIKGDDKKNDAKKNAEAADGGVEDAGKQDAGATKDEPPPTLKTHHFLAAKNILRALEHLAPLIPRRVLGAAADDKLEKMGLDGSTFLSLRGKSAGKALRIEIGAATYGGSTRYARLDDGTIVLLESKAIRPFVLPPERMMERRLLGVDLEKVVELEVSIEKRSQVFVHRDRQQRKKRFFSTKEKPEERVDEAQSLANELRALRVRSFLSPDAHQDKTAVATLKFRLDDKSERKAEFYEAEDQASYLMRVAPWVVEISLAQGRGIIEDLSVVLPPG